MMMVIQYGDKIASSKDEYEKMKLKSNKSGGMTNYGGVCMPNLATKTTDESKMDNSADEILRSIASTGKYRFMNKEIDFT